MEASPFKLRLSAAASWVRCYAYATMNEGMPDLDEDHTVREEGTAGHWGAHQTHLTGQPVPIGTLAPNGYPITQELHDAIDGYLSRLRGRGLALNLECQLPAYRIHPQCGGTVDNGSYDAPLWRIYIDDLKLGYVPVDPFENWQMIGYACAMFDALNIPQADWHRVTFELTIYQPRAYSKTGPAKVWIVTFAQMWDYWQTLSHSAHQAFNDPLYAVTGLHCNNCNGRHHCATLMLAGAAALEVASEAQVLDLPGPALETELERIETAIELLNARKTGLEATAVHMLRNGGSLSRYGMRPGRGATVWNEGKENEVLILGELLGQSLGKTVVPITPTQAKARLPEAVIEAYSHRVPGAMKLTRLDPNEARKIFTAV